MIILRIIMIMIRMVMMMMKIMMMKKFLRVKLRIAITSNNNIIKADNYYTPPPTHTSFLPIHCKVPISVWYKAFFDSSTLVLEIKKSCHRENVWKKDESYLTPQFSGRGVVLFLFLLPRRSTRAVH